MGQNVAHTSNRQADRTRRLLRVWRWVAVVGISATTLALIYPWVADDDPAAPAGAAPTPAEVEDASTTAAPPESAAVAPHVDTTSPPGPPPEGMVWVPGGVFWMGSEDPRILDARPLHLVELSGYWMDRTEVSNADFERFVAATGYQTVAERKPDARDFPDAPPENLVPGSIVFSPPDHAVMLNDHYQWWQYVPGASWRHPTGPSSSVNGLENHPVVHIAWEDAMAYARWANKRLPTEAEYEFAARGGLDREPYAWGHEQQPEGHWVANIWQGDFPQENTEEDGFRATAPVGTYPPNAFGLVDLAGNVWEWCADWYQPDYYAVLARQTAPARNPAGPVDSFDPLEPGIPKRVQRGGSFLCSDEYCIRYLPGARGKGAIDSGASHIGFRCVRDPRPTAR